MTHSKTFRRHAQAILADAVTKSNVIGIRKALNALAQESASRPLRGISFDEVDQLNALVWKHRPRVVGELHDSGLALLRSPRYAKRLAPVAGIIAALDHFKLVDFEWLDDRHVVPVYQAWSNRGSFKFRNVPWQSGGQGPELIP